MAIVEPRKGGGIALKLPFDPAAEWGERDAYYVTGSVSGLGVRGTLKGTGGAHYLELGPAWCRDTPLVAGAVEVDLVPEGPQVADLAPEFLAALTAEPRARRFFESLAPFYRTGYVRWVMGAKRPETRAKRIAETVAALKAGRRQR